MEQELKSFYLLDLALKARKLLKASSITITEQMHMKENDPKWGIGQGEQRSYELQWAPTGANRLQEM